eukprot:GHVN01060050.1.p1 GENE.GHVN01060050.1~~GHVN01060050.1.p1  ORF type:complete len:1026 (-),score=157.91 GHVN01060050.1:3266-6274(-)
MTRPTTVKRDRASALADLVQGNRLVACRFPQTDLSSIAKQYPQVNKRAPGFPFASSKATPQDILKLNQLITHSCLDGKPKLPDSTVKDQEQYLYYWSLLDKHGCPERGPGGPTYPQNTANTHPNNSTRIRNAVPTVGCTGSHLKPRAHKLSGNVPTTSPTTRSDASPIHTVQPRRLVTTPNDSINSPFSVEYQPPNSFNHGNEPLPHFQPTPARPNTQAAPSIYPSAAPFAYPQPPQPPTPPTRTYYASPTPPRPSSPPPPYFVHQPESYIPSQVPPHSGPPSTPLPAILETQRPPTASTTLHGSLAPDVTRIVNRMSSTQRKEAYQSLQQVSSGTLSSKLSMYHISHPESSGNLTSYPSLNTNQNDDSPTQGDERTPTSLQEEVITPPCHSPTPSNEVVVPSNERSDRSFHIIVSPPSVVAVESKSRSNIMVSPIPERNVNSPESPDSPLGSEGGPPAAMPSVPHPSEDEEIDRRVSVISATSSSRHPILSHSRTPTPHVPAPLQNNQIEFDAMDPHDSIITPDFVALHQPHSNTHSSDIVAIPQTIFVRPVLDGVAVLSAADYSITLTPKNEVIEVRPTWSQTNTPSASFTHPVERMVSRPAPSHFPQSHSPTQPLPQRHSQTQPLPQGHSQTLPQRHSQTLPFPPPQSRTQPLPQPLQPNALLNDTSLSTTDRTVLTAELNQPQQTQRWPLSFPQAPQHTHRQYPSPTQFLTDDPKYTRLTKCQQISTQPLYTHNTTTRTPTKQVEITKEDLPKWVRVEYGSRCLGCKQLLPPIICPSCDVPFKFNKVYADHGEPYGTSPSMDTTGTNGPAPYNGGSQLVNGSGVSCQFCKQELPNPCPDCQRPFTDGSGQRGRQSLASWDSRGHTRHGRERISGLKYIRGDEAGGLGNNRADRNVAGSKSDNLPLYEARCAGGDPLPPAIPRRKDWCCPNQDNTPRQEYYFMGNRTAEKGRDYLPTDTKDVPTYSTSYEYYPKICYEVIRPEDIESYVKPRRYPGFAT